MRWLLSHTVRCSNPENRIKRRLQGGSSEVRRRDAQTFCTNRFARRRSQLAGELPEVARTKRDRGAAKCRLEPTPRVRSCSAWPAFWVGARSPTFVNASG